MRPLTLVSFAIIGAVLVFIASRLSSARPESLVYGAIMGVVLVLAYTRINGRSPSLSLNRPRIWDVLTFVFILSGAFVAEVIGDVLVAGLVMVLTGIVLFLAERRFGRPRTEPVS